MAAKFVVVVETPENAAPAISGDDTQTCKNLAAFFNKVAGGNAPGAEIRVLNNAISGVYQLEFLSALNDGDEIRLPTQTLFAETGTVDTASKFAAGVSAEADAASFAARVNAHADWNQVFTATVSGAVISLAFHVPGWATNQITITESTSGARIDNLGLDVDGSETAVTFST